MSDIQFAHLRDGGDIGNGFVIQPMAGMTFDTKRFCQCCCLLNSRQFLSAPSLVLTIPANMQLDDIRPDGGGGMNFFRAWLDE